MLDSKFISPSLLPIQHSLYKSHLNGSAYTQKGGSGGQTHDLSGGLPFNSQPVFSRAVRIATRLCWLDLVGSWRPEVGRVETSLQASPVGNWRTLPGLSPPHQRQPAALSHPQQVLLSLESQSSSASIFLTSGLGLPVATTQNKCSPLKEAVSHKILKGPRAERQPSPFYRRETKTGTCPRPPGCETGQNWSKHIQGRVGGKAGTHVGGEDPVDEVLLGQVEGALQLVVVEGDLTRGGNS